MSFNKNLLMPGDYSPPDRVPCDERRSEFDLKNDLIIESVQPVDIVLIGDSITHFFEESIYLRKYGLVVNRGIGGDEVQFISWRFKADVVQLRPRLCICLMGINNTWTLENTKDENGHFSEAAITDVIEKIKTNYIKMLNMAKEACFDLWICSVLPLGAEISSSGERNLSILRINEELKNLAVEYNTRFVDYHSALVKEDGLTMLEGISREGCHPNGVGYKIMSGVLTAMLDKYFLC